MVAKSALGVAVVWLASIAILTAFGPGGRFSSLAAGDNAGLRTDAIPGGVQKAEIIQRSRGVLRSVLGEREALPLEFERQGFLWNTWVRGSDPAENRAELVWDARDGHLVSLTFAAEPAAKGSEAEAPSALSPWEAQRMGCRWLARLGLTAGGAAHARAIGIGRDSAWRLDWSGGRQEYHMVLDRETGWLRYLRTGRALPRPLASSKALLSRTR